MALMMSVITEKPGTALPGKIGIRAPDVPVLLPASPAGALGSGKARTFPALMGYTLYPSPTEVRMSRSEAFWAITATALVVLLIGAFIPSPSRPATAVVRAAQPAPQQPMPQYGWKMANSQEWALRAGGTLTGDHPTFINSPEKVRLVLSSTQPVNIGFKTRFADETEMDLCAAASVMSATRDCELPAGSSIKFHVEDLRTGHNFAVGAGAWLLGGTNRAMMDATAINRVKLDTFAWTCIANCSP